MVRVWDLGFRGWTYGFKFIGAEFDKRLEGLCNLVHKQGFDISS